MATRRSSERHLVVPPYFLLHPLNSTPSSFPLLFEGCPPTPAQGQMRETLTFFFCAAGRLRLVILFGHSPTPVSTGVLVGNMESGKGEGAGWPVALLGGCLGPCLSQAWRAVPTPSTRGRNRPANPARLASAAKRVWG